jgi:heme/copper-type cytochrome/quinol oxidase subunit 4
MKHPIILGALTLTLPLSAHAQDAQTMLQNLTGFIDGTVIPFLFGITFLFFVVNVVRFFVFQGTNEDGKENARNLLTYSVLAFVFIVIFWGMINLLAGSVGLEGDTQPDSDYVDLHNGGGYAPPYCPPGQAGAC